MPHLLRSWWWTLTTEEAGSVWLTWSMRSLVPSSVLVIAFALLFVFECIVANMVNDKSDKGSRPVLQNKMNEVLQFTVSAQIYLYF